MKVRIEDKSGFKTLVATTDILKGQSVFQCYKREIQQQQTYQTVQIEHSKHIRNRLLDCVNHSCSPNSVFNINNLVFVALKNIYRGDEITFFYPGSEIKLVRPFLCQCAEENCLGYIIGGFYLSKEQIKYTLRNELCTEFMQRQFQSLMDSGRLNVLQQEALASPSLRHPVEQTPTVCSWASI